MRGTAPRVDLWILLEFNELWTQDPIKSNTLTPDVQHWLSQTVTLLKEEGRFPRVQMIRGKHSKSSGYSIYIAQSGELRHQTAHSYAELPELDLFSQNFGELVSSNTYYICTHGTRDVCCAKFGHRTWSVLDQLSNGRAWQCSHLGGHRFAPNVLVFPQARLYGRVHADSVANFFRIIEEGKIPTEYLRGRSELSPEEQVAETGKEAVRGSPIQIRDSCSKDELKTVFPFIET